MYMYMYYNPVLLQLFKICLDQLKKLKSEIIQILRSHHPPYVGDFTEI